MLPSLALADSDITVTIDGNELEMDVSPVIDNGRILVPLRAIFEGLGMTVDYDSATQTITGSGGENTIILQLNNTLAYVGTATVTLDVPAQSIDGRTLVPIRFVAENCGADVVWNSANMTVEITTKSGSTGGSSQFTDTTVTGTVDYDTRERLLQTEYGTVIYGSHVITHNYVYIYEEEYNPDGLGLVFYIAPKSFNSFLDIRDEDEDYLLNLYAGIAKNLSKYYGKDVTMRVIYYNTYYTYPEAFEDNLIYDAAITDQGNGSWLIIYPLIQIDVDKDDIQNYHYWWGY